MQGEEVIEDWEVWGDPREVERRKAARRRAAQPLPVRQAQVVAFENFVKKRCGTIAAVFMQQTCILQ